MNKEIIHLYNNEDVITQKGLDMARCINPAIKSLIEEAIKDGVSLRDLESVLTSEIAIMVSEAILSSNFSKKFSNYKNKEKQ